MKYPPQKIDLRIFDKSNDTSSVDVATLTSLLEGVQKAVFILAENELGHTLTKEEKKGFTLKCLVPQKGSYAIPIEFGTMLETLFENETNTALAVKEKFTYCYRGIMENTPEAFNQVSGYLRSKLFAAFRETLPKSGATWNLGISGDGFSEIVLNGKSRTTLRQFQESVLLSAESAQQYQTVTGYLVAMEFEERCLTLKYPATGTELKCYYNNEIEVELFENRKELIQVTGNITYDNDKETPKKLTNVDAIQVLDLTEFTLEMIQLDDSIDLQFDQPLVLTPELTDDKQYMTIENTYLGIDVIAQTHDELWEEVVAGIRHLWKFYAKEHDEKLGHLFITTKRNLCKAIKEVPNDNS